VGGSTRGKELTIMKRALLASGLALLACFVLSFVVYPWSTYYGQFSYSRGETLSSYVFLSAVVGMITLIAAIVARDKPVPSGILSLALLCGLALLMGPCGADLPGLRVRGIFFSEWKFAVFIFELALPVTVLSTFTLWFRRT
jgi:hypothetical protein